MSLTPSNMAEKLSQEELQRLRNVSIFSILGVPYTGRRKAISCPHGNSDSDPSCWLYPDNTWHCFSCGRHGNNALDFMVEIEGSFLKAVEELVKHV